MVQCESLVASEYVGHFCVRLIMYVSEWGDELAHATSLTLGLIPGATLTAFTYSNHQPKITLHLTLPLSYTPHITQVWDVRTGRCIHTLTGHQGEISSCQFNYASDLCISGSIDRTCKVTY